MSYKRDYEVGTPFKVEIGSLDDATVKVTAQFNPKELTVDKSVPWTKPEDIPFDATGKTPLPALGGISKEGFLGVYADASVEFHRFPIDPAYLRGLINRADARGRDFKNGKGEKEKLP